MVEDTFQCAVRLELQRARELYPQRRASLHESWAVMAEELDEVWEIVRQKNAVRSRHALLTELVQLAAAVQRTWEDYR